MAGPRTVESKFTVASVIRDELELILKRPGRTVHRRVVDDTSVTPVVDEAVAPDPTASPTAEPANVDEAMMNARVAMLRAHTTGLAFSGGGIRSGTFAVGFLQGLAGLGLLSRFDYLSTVSGGGYAGGWLAAWLKREGNLENVEKQLNVSRVRQAEADRLYLPTKHDSHSVVDEEPEPLRHLRAYSSYMTPRAGFLTADTWTVILIWARNVTINLMLILPLAVLVVLLARLVVCLDHLLNADVALNDTPRWIVAAGLFAIGFVALVISMYDNRRYLKIFRRGEAPNWEKHGDPQRVWFYRIFLPMLICIATLTIPARWISAWIGDQLSRNQFAPNTTLSRIWDVVTSYLSLLGPVTFIGFALVFGLCLFLGALTHNAKHRWKFAGASFMAGATSGVLFVLLLAVIRAFAQAQRSDLIATFAFPGGILVVIAAMIVEVAFAGRAMTEGEREWWARFSARLTIAGIVWVVVMASILYLPGLFLAAGPLAKTALTTGWLGTTAFGVLTGRYVLPKRQRGSGGGLGSLGTIAAVAPPIFLIGSLGAVALLVSLVLNSPGLLSPRGDRLTAFAYYLQGVERTSFVLIFLMAFFSAIFADLALKVVDVNLFSLNAMYANRLARCYLGASRRMKDWKDRWGRVQHDQSVNAGAPTNSERNGEERNANPVTGFDSDDDLNLADLRIGSVVGNQCAYDGPHLLINTTINLVAGKNLAWRDRKGDSFVLSPLYCGAKEVGYARIPDEPHARSTLTLGRAMSISGAAVDPNMSFYQTGALTALLTLFNARLGYWLENPNPARRGQAGENGKSWKAESAKYGDVFLKELLGQTDDKEPYVHLSDGGHFENLGVYELIRRRCRYIVAVDAGEDSAASDESLATLIRLCRIDFGVRIQLDTTPLIPKGPDNLSRTHVVVGHIRYDDVDHGEMPGVLVYVKISMTGDEAPDLQSYARADSRFPHQPTDLRQSFDERQFECYRCLGDHIASSVFEEAVAVLHRDREFKTLSYEDFAIRLFAAVQARWAEAPDAQDEKFLESTRAWINLHRDLRTRPELADLSRDLYPELPTPTPNSTSPIDPAERERAELHVVAQMLQIMENAWLVLGLRRYSALPMNRGWMNACRRWVGTSAMQRFWPSLRSEFGADFVRFCEDELHLNAPKANIHRLSDLHDDPFRTGALTLLDREFAREWPEDPSRGLLGLPELLKRAAALASDRIQPPIWLITAPASDAAGEPIVFGIILLAELPEQPDTSGKAGRELFVWIRRGHRSMGYGAKSIREVLTAGRKESLLDDVVWARYPKTGRDGDEDSERNVWLTVLAQFNFRISEPNLNHQTTGPKYTLLKCDPEKS